MNTWVCKNCGGLLDYEGAPNFCPYCRSTELTSERSIEELAAERDGPPWSTDHPGRKCRLCALTVYPLWIDKLPPPGTCPHQAASADACRHNIETAVQGMVFALQAAIGRVPELRLTLIARGLDPAEIETMARDDIAVLKDHHLLEQAAIEVRGVRLHHWLGEQPDKALVRAAQVMVAISRHLEIAAGDLDEAERAAFSRRLRRQLTNATADLLQLDEVELADPPDAGAIDDAVERELEGR